MVLRSVLIAVFLWFLVPIAMASGHGQHHASMSESGEETSFAYDHGSRADEQQRVVPIHIPDCIDAGASLPSPMGSNDCLGCCPDDSGASDAVTVDRRMAGPDATIEVKSTAPPNDLLKDDVSPGGPVFSISRAPTVLRL